MAYIGKQPTVGNFVKLDAITTSATATYNLLNGGVAYSPQSPNHCIVSLNGVIQSPTTSFTISGSTIVFASALTATDVIDFILVLGDVLNIGTPSDATVGFSKVTSNLITGATAETSIAGDDNILIYDDSATALRKMTRTNFVSGLNNTPAFMAYNNGSTTQSITTAVWTEATIYGVESFDTDSAFNTTTCRFTPQVAGKYFFTASIFGPDFTAGFNGILLSKNGSSDLDSSSNTGNLTALAIDFVSVNGIITLNGTTDYVSIFVNQQAGVSKNIGGGSGAAISFFGGYRLIGA